MATEPLSREADLSEEPPASQAPPPSFSGNPLEDLGPLAERLRIDVERLLETYSDAVDEEDPPSDSPGWVLEEQLEVLTEDTERLQNVYDRVADRRGLDIKRRRLVRKIRARAGRLAGGAQDVETVWLRADDVVSTGRRIAKIVSQLDFELDAVSRALWRDVQGELASVERLASQARRGG